MLSIDREGTRVVEKVYRARDWLCGAVAGEDSSGSGLLKAVIKTQSSLLLDDIFAASFSSQSTVHLTIYVRPEVHIRLILFDAGTQRSDSFIF